MVVTAKPLENIVIMIMFSLRQTFVMYTRIRVGIDAQPCSLNKILLSGKKVKASSQTSLSVSGLTGISDAMKLTRKKRGRTFGSISIWSKIKIPKHYPSLPFIFMLIECAFLGEGR